MLNFYLAYHIFCTHLISYYGNTPWVWKAKQKKVFEAVNCLLSQDAALAHYVNIKLKLTVMHQHTGWVLVWYM